MLNYWKKGTGFANNEFICSSARVGPMPDNKVHGANMGPTWVLSAPDGPNVGPMNLAIRVFNTRFDTVFIQRVTYSHVMVTSSNGNILRVTGPLCPGEFPTQRPVTRSFDVFFDLGLNKRLSKQPWGWWFGLPSWSLWLQCNAQVLLGSAHIVY